MEELDAFLDERIGSDPDLLQDLLGNLTKERDELEQQASRPRKFHHSQFTRSTRSLARHHTLLSFLYSCVER